MTFYYIYRFFREFCPVYPVYMILFRETGLSFVQISVLMGLWALSMLLAEIPSGIVADLWSRRFVIALGLVLKGGGFLVWLLFPTFTGFAAGFLLWGFQEALTSGTDEALLFDALKLKGREDSFEKFAGRASLLDRVAIALSMVLGGALFSRLPVLVLPLSAGALSLSTLAVLFVPEPSVKERTGTDGERLPGFGALTGALKAGLRIRGLPALVLFGCSFMAAYGAAEEYDSLFGLEWGTPLVLIGIWSGLRFLVEGLGGLLAGPLGRVFNGKRPYALPLWVATAGLALIAGAFLKSRFAAGPYLLFYLMIPPAEILMQGQMQRQFDSAGRATLGSVVSFIFTGLAIVAGLALGWVAERQGIRGLFALAGGLVLMAGLGGLVIPLTRLGRQPGS
jgi:hypothetical protein